MNFFEKVYKIVSKIPKGKVLTYKEVARLSGVKNPRVVGFALHVNKDIIHIPCHRVVGINGDLVGYASGIRKKRKILIEEGIKFQKNGKIDLDKYLFRL